MASLTKVLCLQKILRVDAEARIGDFQELSSAQEFSYLAVYDGEIFSGVIPLHNIMNGNMQRILADIVPNHKLPLIHSSATLEEIGHILQDVSPSGVVLVDENGGYEGVVTKEDLLRTLLIESQEKLGVILKLEEQQEKFRLLGRMSSALVHDLNNILTGILGSLELAQSQTGKDKLLESDHIGIALKAAYDAVGAIKRFQNYYVPIKFTTKLKHLDLGVIAKDVIEFTRPKWKEEAESLGRSMEVKLGIQPTPPVLGNPGEIRQVLTNLVINAIDAIPNNGCIEIKVYSQGPFSVVEVGDNGTGMTPEQCLHCFDPFFTTKVHESGSGLGLSNSRMIVQDHKGRLEFESELGKGTVFRVLLPKTEPNN